MTKKIVVYGNNIEPVLLAAEKFPQIEIVERNADAVICYGGDGTLLAAELEWPDIPKIPIRNSRRGYRCMPYEPEEVLKRFLANELFSTQFIKLECALFHTHERKFLCSLMAMNEFNVHMERINSAVRFRLFLNGETYLNGLEIIGDGFIVSTPFGSTAYYNKITRGIFHQGMGIAFKNTAEHVNHLVVPDDMEIRIQIVRGPAVLAFDNSQEYFSLEENDEMVIRKSSSYATLLTCNAIPHPCAIF